MWTVQKDGKVFSSKPMGSLCKDGNAVLWTRNKKTNSYNLSDKLSAHSLAMVCLKKPIVNDRPSILSK